MSLKKMWNEIKKNKQFYLVFNSRGDGKWCLRINFEDGSSNNNNNNAG